ncbi:hypothetical protein CKA47_35685, partial [Pseudomonas aeruginosa]
PRLGWRVQVANETTPAGQVKTYEYSGSAWTELVGGMADAPSDGKRYARLNNAWAGLGAAAVADILGTVSQAGGMPTGAIYEGGSNANGSYVRLADGTQICSSSLLTFTAEASSVGARWTFPANFVSPSMMFGSVVASGAGADYDPGIAARNQGTVYFNSSTNYANLGFLCISSASFTPGAQTRNNRAIAIGRWF